MFFQIKQALVFFATGFIRCIILIQTIRLHLFDCEMGIIRLHEKRLKG